MKKNMIGELVGGYSSDKVSPFITGIVTEIIKRNGKIVKYRVHWADGDVLYLNCIKMYRRYLREEMKKW